MRHQIPGSIALDPDDRRPVAVGPERVPVSLSLSTTGTTLSQPHGEISLAGAKDGLRRFGSAVEVAVSLPLLLLTLLGTAQHVWAQADPVISATKYEPEDAVRLSWSVGSKPFKILVRRDANPAVDPDVVLQDGYTLYTYDHEGALVYTASPVLYYSVQAASGDDTTAPTINVTSPATGTSIPTNTPNITVAYSDGGPITSGLDLSTLRIQINGVEFSGAFTKGPSSASYTVPAGAPLPDGINSITASVADTVGNSSSSDSSFSANGPIINSLTPSAGLAGDPVTISGDGFDASAPGNNQVTFDGVPAVVSTATATDLSVTVPIGALTGPVEVTVAGRTSNTLTFTVEIAKGFSRINNFWFNGYDDLVVFDRWANTVYCVANGTTTKVTLDTSSSPALRPVGLGVADAPSRLFYGRNNSTPNYGPIHTIDAQQNCATGGRQDFRNVQDTGGYPGFTYATAHRKGVYLGENAVYVAYRESPSGTYYYVFRVKDFGPRDQVPPGYTFPSSWTIVTGMTFDDSHNLFVTNGAAIYYVPAGAGSGADVRTITSPLLNQPAGMTFDDRGTLYVADQAQGTIVRIRPSFTGAGGSFDGTLETIASGLATGTGGVRSLEFRRFSGRPFLAVAEAPRLFWLSLLEVEATEIEFDHKAPTGSGSAVDIRHDMATDVQTPEWSILSQPRNEPVVYVEGQPVQLRVRFRSSPGIASADIRATGSDGAFDLLPENVTFTNGVSGWVTFTAAGTAPGRAPEQFGLTLQWKMSNVNGGGSSEVSINQSGVHPIYLVYADPGWPENKGILTREPWLDEGLGKAVVMTCGAASQTDALAELARKLYDANEFDYSGTAAMGTNGYGAGTDYLNLTSLLAGRAIECVGSTKYFVILGRAMGIPSDKLRAKRCGVPDPTGCDLAWQFPTEDIRITHTAAASCAATAWCFHMFPYDTTLSTVNDPLLKVDCTVGSPDDGAVPANMAVDYYHQKIDPGDENPLPCADLGLDVATMKVD